MSDVDAVTSAVGTQQDTAGENRETAPPEAPFWSYFYDSQANIEKRMNELMISE